MSRALCAPENLTEGMHADDWFAHPRSAAARRAVETCTACPLMMRCADNALEEGVPYGIHGGLTATDRELVWEREGGKPQGFIDSILLNVGPLLQERRDREHEFRMPVQLAPAPCHRCGSALNIYARADRSPRWQCNSCRNRDRRVPNGYVARREARLAAMGHGTEAVA